MGALAALGGVLALLLAFAAALWADFLRRRSVVAERAACAALCRELGARHGVEPEPQRMALRCARAIEARGRHDEAGTPPAAEPLHG